MRSTSATVWIVKEWYVWPFAWMLAGRKYVHNIDEFITKIVDPAFAQGRRYDRLHILSHGNRWRDRATGTVIGHYINMGGGDRLDTNDLDENLLPRYRTKTDLFIRVLRDVMEKESNLVFSACGQGDGALLKSISFCLGNDIVVSGYRGLGHPFGRGNIAFKNGNRVEP